VGRRACSGGYRPRGAWAFPWWRTWRVVRPTTSSNVSKEYG
jgi:hypothetical protein